MYIRNCRERDELSYYRSYSRQHKTQDIYKQSAYGLLVTIETEKWTVSTPSKVDSCDRRTNIFDRREWNQRKGVGWDVYLRRESSLRVEESPRRPMVGRGLYYRGTDNPPPWTTGEDFRSSSHTDGWPMDLEESETDTGLSNGFGCECGWRKRGSFGTETQITRHKR